jgi:threonine/homoserine/homoserine lactone efflux protein
MVPVNEIGAFALATLGESINPGPTLAALVSARTRGRQESWGVVLGVALANIAWVIIVVLLRLFASRLPPWPEAEPLLKAIAALILVFIATRASAWAVVTGAESYILKNWSEPMATAPASGAKSFAGAVSRGFLVHFFNPLSLTYYFGAYSGTLVSDPSLAFIFSIVAVFVDFIVYVLASLPVELLLKPSPTTFVVQRIFALFASFAMLFLVAHVFAIDRGLNAPSELHALRNLLMLLGFLAGTICEAENFAVRYSKNKNKLLWRGVLVWQSAFGAFAIIGTFLSVLWRIDPDSFGIGKSLISAMAICSLVAAVATAALSYARARGEMLNEAESAFSAGNAQNLTQTLSLNSPKFVFPALLAGFVLLFAFFVMSGFSDKFGR